MKKDWKTFILAIGLLFMATYPVMPNSTISMFMGLALISIWIYLVYVKKR